MRRVHFILAAVLLGIVLATGACSGRKDKPAASAPSVSAASLQYRALEGEMLSKALDEIRSELCPPGLDPQVFELHLEPFGLQSQPAGFQLAGVARTDPQAVERRRHLAVV